jgi:hypothetical protein
MPFKYLSTIGERQGVEERVEVRQGFGSMMAMMPPGEMWLSDTNAAIV